MEQEGKWTLAFRACETRHFLNSIRVAVKRPGDLVRAGQQKRAVSRNGAKLNHPCDSWVEGGDCLLKCSKENSAFFI